jgi:hypothetical protein
VGNRSRIAIELAAVAAIAALALGFGIGDAGMASGYVDPLLHAGAQDEAVYGHAAARMVRTGDWLTPVFLERFMLNKPPLLMWAGAASMSLAGINAFALRLPVLAAGVFCCVLVYWWLRRSHSVAAAFAGVALLAAVPVFQSIARKFMTDALLTLFVMAAMFLIAIDPGWQWRATPIAFGALSGAALMTKSAAGLVPLLILAVYWLLAGSKERPPLARMALAVAVAAVIAAPWHVYQFLVHRDWFTAEYVRFQLLGSGVTAPSRYNEDTNFWFYLKTLWRSDPILLALSVSGLPWMAMGWKGSHRVHARLLAAWLVTTAVCLGIFGTRAAYYLLPLLPAMALMAVEFSPLFRGRVAWVTCAALIVVFFVTADYAPRTAPGAAVLDSYARLRRNNELVIVSPEDEFYASVIDVPKIRYLYLSPLDATKTAEFFYRLGMIVTSDQFCSLPGLLPAYEQRLRAWKLPEGLHPEATLIDASAISRLAQVIECSPDRDFLIPESMRSIATDAGAATHTGLGEMSGRFLLLSKKSTPRPAGSIALGTVAPD